MIDMEQYRKQVAEAAAFVAGRLQGHPEILIQLGTGLGELISWVEDPQILPYTEIPHFPGTTVVSHQGRLIQGRLQGRQVLVFQGRLHCYEGYSAREVAFPVRMAALLGVKVAIITNAAGGLNPDYNPGTIMVFADHLNFIGANPLQGPNIDQWGERFPDLSEPYDPVLRRLAMQAARELALPDVVPGTYVGVAGPSLETPAETRFLRLAGADAVGMSSIPEILVAIHSGLRVLGLSVIANVNDPDHMRPILLEDIIAAANQAQPRLARLIRAILRAAQEGS